MNYKGYRVILRIILSVFFISLIPFAYAKTFIEQLNSQSVSKLDYVRQGLNFQSRLVDLSLGGVGVMNTELVLDLVYFEFDGSNFILNIRALAKKKEDFNQEVCELILTQYQSVEQGLVDELEALSPVEKQRVKDNFKSKVLIRTRDRSHSINCSD